MKSLLRAASLLMVAVGVVLLLPSPRAQWKGAPPEPRTLLVDDAAALRWSKSEWGDFFDERGLIDVAPDPELPALTVTMEARILTLRSAAGRLPIAFIAHGNPGGPEKVVYPTHVCTDPCRVPTFRSWIVPNGSGRRKAQNRANELELLGFLDVLKHRWTTRFRRGRDSNTAVLLRNFEVFSGLPTSVPTSKCRIADRPA